MSAGRNRWASLLEDNLDSAHVHRIIAETVAEREAVLMRDAAVSSGTQAVNTPLTSHQPPQSQLRRGAAKDAAPSTRYSARPSSPLLLQAPARESESLFSLTEKLAEAQAEAQAQAAEAEAAREELE